MKVTPRPWGKRGRRTQNHLCYSLVFECFTCSTRFIPCQAASPMTIIERQVSVTPTPADDRSQIRHHLLFKYISRVWQLHTAPLPGKEKCKGGEKSRRKDDWSEFLKRFESLKCERKKIYSVSLFSPDKLEWTSLKSSAPKTRFFFCSSVYVYVCVRESMDMWVAKKAELCCGCV